jgi:hypothetical protein
MAALVHTFRRGIAKMSKATLEQVLRLVRDLSAEEQVELQRTLDGLLNKPRPAMTEDEFERRMITAGLLGERKPPPDDSPRDFAPVRTTGRPVSEIIIEERR